MAPLATPHGDYREEEITIEIPGKTHGGKFQDVNREVYKILPGQHQEQLLQALSGLPIPRNKYNMKKL